MPLIVAADLAERRIFIYNGRDRNRKILKLMHVNCLKNKRKH